MILFDLPLPPSANHHWVRTRAGGMALSAAAKAYRKEVWGVVTTQTTPEQREALSGPFALHVWVRLPAKRSRDLDNCLKETQDAVMGALGVDDVQVVELHAYSHRMPPDLPDTACVVLVEELTA